MKITGRENLAYKNNCLDKVFLDDGLKGLRMYQNIWLKYMVFLGMVFDRTLSIYELYGQ